MTRFTLLFGMLAFLLPSLCFGQFNLLGSAVPNPTLPDCYTITPNLGNQAGAMWSTAPIDLTNSFDFIFEVNLGCTNANGADGMVFVMHTNNMALGTAGGSLGYAGITPSLGVEFDTWQNPSDPFADHTAIISNGVTNHTLATNLAGPVNMVASGANTEDCQYHDVRIVWNAAVDSMKVYFDCDLRLEYTGDIITNIFGGNPIVFWGFTAGTGGASNTHIVCIDPDLISGGQSFTTSTCLGDSVQLSADPGASYSWSPASAFNNPLIQNPSVAPVVNSTYTVEILDACGFSRVDTFEVLIDSSTFVVDLGADFSICIGEDTVISPQLPASYQYLWQNGSSNPSLTVNAPGLYWVEVEGLCSINRDSVMVSLSTAPSASFTMAATACVDQTVTLTYTGNAAPSDTYTWNFGTGMVLSGTGQGPYQIQWSNAGTQTVSLQVEGNGCPSNTVSETIQINPTPIPTFTVNPSLCLNEQAQLTYTGTSPASATFVWGLDGGIPAVTGPGPHLISWPSSGTKTITLTVEENGCVSAPFSQQVIVNPLPDASFLLQASVCEGDPTQVSYIGLSDSTASYAWTFGGGQVLNGTGQGPYQVQWLTAGSKTICLQVQENGCLSPLICQTIEVTARPDVSIAPVPNQCFDGNSFNFSASGGPADTYIWNFGSSANPPMDSSATPPAIVYQSPGIKTVSLVTIRNGCVGDSSIISFEVVEEPNADFLVSSQAVCTDTCITFSYAGSGPIPATQSFLWDFGPGAVPAISTLINPPCVEYVTGGSKTVTLTVSYKGCTTTTSQSVQVAVAPLSVAGVDKEYCEGSGGVQLDGTVSGGTAPYFYSWWCDNPPNCGIGNVAIEDPMVNPTVTQPTEIVEYYFQITDVNGCTSRIDTVQVTVKARPLMDAGIDTALCPPSAPGAFLQGSLAVDNNAPGPIDYFWSPAAGLNNANNNPNPYARPDTTTIYTLIGVSANGCSSLVNTLDPLSTVEVTVKPRPIGSAGPDTAMCVGDQVQLQAFASGSGPDYQYLWSPTIPGTIDDPTSPTPIMTPEATTIFTLTVISNGCESDGDQIEIVVDTKPTLTAGTDETICLNDSVQLDGRANGDPDALSYHYEWSPIIGLDNPLSATPMASPIITTEYILRVTSPFGCESANDTVLVTVEPTPEVALLNPDTVICEGTEIVLNATHSFTTPVGGPVIYAWSPTEQILTDIYATSVTVAPTRTTRYIVKTSIASNDCPTYDDVLVVVNPKVEASIEADTNRVCAGDPIQLRGTGGLGDADFLWSPAIGLDDSTSMTPIASPTATTTYQLIVSEDVCADTSEFEIIVNPGPETAFLSTLTEGCAPLDVAFEPIGTDATSFLWEFGDGSVINNVEAPTHRFSSPGEYAVQLTTTGTGACKGISETMIIRVFDSPVADFSASPFTDEPISLPDAPVQFTDASQGASARSWIWDFGDGSFSTEQNPNHIYETAGSYPVSLTVSDSIGCVSTITYSPFVIFRPDVVIPNIFSPNADGINDEFQIRYSGKESFNYSIRDRWGRLVFQGDSPNATWDGRVDGNEVSEGVYYYFLKVGSEDFTGNVTLLR